MARVPLFRPEAIEAHQEGARFGAPLLKPPPPALLAWLLAALVAVFAAFLAVGSYAQKETVPGLLSPVHGVVKVLPSRAGLVTAVHVTEGQEVNEGDPLVTVRVGGSDGRGRDVDDAVLDALRRQRDELAGQAELERAREATEARRIAARVASLAAEAGAMAQEQAAQRKRTRVAEEQVAAVRDLVSGGYVSQVEYKRRQDNFYSQQQNEAALLQRLAANRGEAAEQRSALEALPQAVRAKVSALHAAAAEIEARLAETEGRRAYLLRAPVMGRISTLQARVGLAADPAIPQLAIVPHGSALQGELLVPARAIGFVRSGQRVRLAYDAFPFQRFGFQGGQVETVSQTLLRPAEFTGPMSLKEPSYRVLVELDRQTIRVGGLELPLGPDLALRADIVLDRRSLFEWLFAPIIDARGRSL